MNIQFPSEMWTRQYNWLKTDQWCFQKPFCGHHACDCLTCIHQAELNVNDLSFSISCSAVSTITVRAMCRTPPTPIATSKLVHGAKRPTNPHTEVLVKSSAWRHPLRSTEHEETPHGVASQCSACGSPLCATEHEELKFDRFWFDVHQDTTRGKDRREDGPFVEVMWERFGTGILHSSRAFHAENGFDQGSDGSRLLGRPLRHGLPRRQCNHSDR